MIVGGNANFGLIRRPEVKAMFNETKQIESQIADLNVIVGNILHDLLAGRA